MKTFSIAQHRISGGIGVLGRIIRVIYFFNRYTITSKRTKSPRNGVKFLPVGRFETVGVKVTFGEITLPPVVISVSISLQYGYPTQP